MNCKSLTTEQLLRTKDDIETQLREVTKELLSRQDLGSTFETSSKTGNFMIPKDLSDKIFTIIQNMFMDYPNNVFRFGHIRTKVATSGIVLNKTIENHIRNKVYSLLTTRYSVTIERMDRFAGGYKFKQRNY